MTNSPTTRPVAMSTEPMTSDAVFDEIRTSIETLRYGSVTIIVQDGLIVQIDRTEKRRLTAHRANLHGT